MDKISLNMYDKYIKGIMEISEAITSDRYLEDIFKIKLVIGCSKGNRR